MMIHEAMARIQADLGAIEKNQKNAFHNFNFRGIDDVHNALYPLLAKHKVFVVPEVLEMTREARTNERGKPSIFTVVKVRYHFTATDGSWVGPTVYGEGADTGDKSVPKAMAIALKYAVLQTFLPPTVGQLDPDAEVTELGDDREARHLHENGLLHRMEPAGKPELKILDGVEDQISSSTLDHLKRKWDDRGDTNRETWAKFHKEEIKNLSPEDRKVLREYAKG